MASVGDVGDKLLWTAVLVTGIAACWYIPYFLTYAKELAVVPPQANEDHDPQLQKAAEDAIGNSTLAELADSPSYNLAASAIRLTAARVFKPDVKLKLLEDLKSKSRAKRERAITGLDLLIFGPSLKDINVKDQFVNRASFEAITDALINIQEENKHRYRSSKGGLPPSPVRPAYRHPHERFLIEVLLFLIEAPRYPSDYHHPQDVQCALDAGLITRWLARYPFPCLQLENAKRNHQNLSVCQLLSREVWGGDDPRMSKLLQKLQRVPGGSKQLVAVGLRQPSSEDELLDTLQTRLLSRPRQSQNTFGLNDLDDEEEEEIEAVEEAELGQLIDDEDLMSLLRGDSAPRNAAEQTPEERSLRRRHRNAIVVAEPGLPFRPENILQRQITESEVEGLVQPEILDSVEVDPEGSISVIRLMEGRSLDEIDGIAMGEFTPRAVLPPDLTFVPLIDGHDMSDEGANTTSEAD